jgi:2-iminoacetate synthase
VSFVSEFNTLPLADLLQTAKTARVFEVGASLAASRPSLLDFARLISPAASGLLEPISHISRRLTQQRFGKVMRLFAPLYLSNECINNCQYCGFSRDNRILRVTLSVEQVRREAQALLELGFRNILLVAGEHPKFVSGAYLRECVAAIHDLVPSVSLEVGPMDAESYRPLVDAGADGLVVYQETYNRAIYDEMHTAGPKKDFDWRLETPERAAAAGFRRLGIAPLYGLGDWRFEAISAAAHAEYLLKHCWKSQLTISFPRLRPCAGEFQPRDHMGDRDLAQLVCALRIMFPDVGLVLSTRESPRLRNGLVQLGITLMSAGSHTEPGGYTGAGTDQLHHTDRGRIVALDTSAAGAPGEQRATEQFHIADERSSREVADFIRTIGYEPVWKDWDAALTA